MLKRLSLLVVAFLMGVVISVSIQACAKDDSTLPNQTGTSNITNSSSNSKCDCSYWSQNQLESSTMYDENGDICYQTKYTYNEKGWMSTCTLTQFAVNSSGVRYKTQETSSVYTYSPSSDIRYNKQNTVCYDATGKVTGSYSYLYEEVLRK